MSIINGKPLEKSNTPEIVHEENGKWYFWDETWADRHGPYNSREEAQRNLNFYCVTQLGENDPLEGIELRYHTAMPGWCKIVGLDIRAIPECEGGGFAIRKDQAEHIVSLTERNRTN